MLKPILGILHVNHKVLMKQLLLLFKQIMKAWSRDMTVLTFGNEHLPQLCPFSWVVSPMCLTAHRMVWTN